VKSFVFAEIRAECVIESTTSLVFVECECCLRLEPLRDGRVPVGWATVGGRWRCSTHSGAATSARPGGLL
jgi:hypothetical protein